jgi:hypothetical protein
MALSGRKCPDCGRSVRQPFQETITGRQVCPDCARSLTLRAAVSVVGGNRGAGAGVWAMLLDKLRRQRRSG